MKYTKDIARERATPIVITKSGRPTAVPVDVESYERDRSAFLVLELLAQGERDYAEERTVSHADVRKDVRQQLAALRENE